MPVFTYRGVNRAGATVTGERTAATKAEATTSLKREQINISKLSEKGKEFNIPTFGGGVDSKELAIFTRQFSVMIDAGLPLVQCLEILAGQQENKTFQKILNGVRASVEGGATLSASMKQYEKVFDPLYYNMVEAGETGGILDTRRQLLEEGQHVAPLELTTHDHIAPRIDAVNLKDRLCDIETDCRDCLHVWLLRIVGALAAPTSMALTCRGRSRRPGCAK
jgi:hypothetical protein